VLLHESRCMRHSPGRLQRCAEFTNLTLAPLSQRISRRQNMNRLARFLILAALSFVLGFYVTPVGFAQAKSAGQKTTLTGCLQKGDDPDDSPLQGKMARRMACGARPQICQNTWATK